MIVQLSDVYAVECIHRDLTAGVSRNLCTFRRCVFLAVWEGGASSSCAALYLATKDRYLRQILVTYMIGNLMIVSYVETYRQLVFVDFQAGFLLFGFCAVLVQKNFIFETLVQHHTHRQRHQTQLDKGQTRPPSTRGQGSESVCHKERQQQQNLVRQTGTTPTGPGRQQTKYSTECKQQKAGLKINKYQLPVSLHIRYNR